MGTALPLAASPGVHCHVVWGRVLEGLARPEYRERITASGVWREDGTCETCWNVFTVWIQPSALRGSFVVGIHHGGYAVDAVVSFPPA